MSRIRISSFILAATLSIASFTSCNGGDRHEHSDTEVAGAYSCPMDCEDGKTYSEADTCPVCGMDLTVVE